jgi:uncharacterized FlaG/YvyC family protein
MISLKEDKRTSFQQVADMNVAYNNPKGDPVQFALGQNEAWKKLEKQCHNIASEFAELMREFGVEVSFSVHECWQTRNIEAVRDALCDIQVFAMGAQHFLGVDGDADMREVVSAVMTRFCKDQEQLDATRAKYKQLGIDCYIEGNFPTVCLKSSSDQSMPEYPKGKFLKAVGYRQPVFSPIEVPEIKSPTDIVQEMAQQREVNSNNAKQIKDTIEKLVTEFKTHLEKVALGLPAYDSNKNNTGDDKLQPPDGKAF